MKKIINMSLVFFSIALFFLTLNVKAIDKCTVYKFDNAITNNYIESFKLPFDLKIESLNEFTKNDLNVLCSILLFLSLVSLSFAILIWYKKGKDEIIETVEFYPPKELNSLEIGFLNDGIVDEKNVLSLLIYLANQGYLKIEKIESDYKFIKLKDYNGNKENEKMFLEGLFANSSKDANGNIYVLKSKLGSDFAYCIHEIIRKMHSNENYKKVYEKKGLFHFILAILYIISIFSVVIPLKRTLDITSIDIYNIESLVGTIIFLIISIPLFTRIICIENLKLKVKNAFIIFGIICFSICFFNLKEILFYTPLVFLTFMIGIISSIGIVICYSRLNKRTNEATLLLGKVRGFKRFLETVQKDKLETLMENDKDYFFKILPYLYVFELTDKWIKDFEDIVLPDINNENNIDVESFIDDCMPTIVSLVVLMITNMSK